MIFVCYITSLPPIATEKVILSGITGEDYGKTTEDYGILCNTAEGLARIGMPVMELRRSALNCLRMVIVIFAK
ncbi:MAG TPA: hypothetical protein DHV42_02650 [Lachnospiraceae bacterium]|nr:hypothetical protein [Lachnospiraceae bacterium]